MNLIKKYIQFNDLPFDSYNMIENADESGAYKYESTPYTYGNGSYAPLKSRTMMAGEKTVTMTIAVNTKKLGCEHHMQYREFVVHNLMQPGKLWCVVGDSLLWAHAFLVNKGEPYSTVGYQFNMDIEFNLPEGVWHRADSHNVFIVPFNLCNFLDCEDYHTLDDCEECCASCKKPIASSCDKCGCGCGGLDKEYSYCNMKTEALQNFYRQCGQNYKIIYDCIAGKRINGENLGTKICKKDICYGTIAGKFYSDTLLNVNSIDLTIKGVLKNPVISINDNTWTIVGEYDGTLRVTPSGTVYYSDDKCCDEVVVAPEKIVIKDGNTFEWEIHHGYNRLIILTNDCCSMACAYIKIDSLVP